MSVLLTHFLYVAEPPRTTTHPQDMKNVVPGKPVMFHAEAVGTKPLNYRWEWKPAMDDSSEWQLCDVKRFPGADSSTLAISSVQKSSEGRYRCVIGNSAGSQTCNAAELTVGKNST